MEDSFMIKKLKDGTVIDHISARNGLLMPGILGLTAGDDTIAILVNAQSRNMRKKDIVKIENRILNDDELSMVALISPDATINIIKDYKVAEKKRSVLPDQIIGILKCPDSACITNHDPEARTSFNVLSRGPLLLSCEYCENKIDDKEVMLQMSAR